MSDTELSDTEPKERNRRASLDQDDRPGENSGIHRSASTKSFGLKAKASFSFRRRGSKPNAAPAPSLSVPEPEKPISARTPPASPSVSSLGGNGVGPTAAQSAYIQRILADPLEHETDPLQRLRRATSGDSEVHQTPANTGLVESLKAFTSVEVLEGENAFACKKCWKVKTGRYKATHATVHEEDETVDPLSPGTSPILAPTATHPPPSISIIGSPDDSARAVSPMDMNRAVVRDGSLGSGSANRNGRSARAPSPLRNRVDDALRPSQAAESATLASTDSALADDESDGLSDTDTDDEEPPQPIAMPIGRPKMGPRKKSSHFVMRRAFKRYLIAKAPEVLVFHFKRFKQTHKTGLAFTSFYDLKKWVFIRVTMTLLTLHRMDDFVSFPETLDLAPFLAPNRNDYKVVPTSSGPRAPYMNWDSPGHMPGLQSVMYRLYGKLLQSTKLSLLIPPQL